MDSKVALLKWFLNEIQSDSKPTSEELEQVLFKAFKDFGPKDPNHFADAFAQVLSGQTNQAIHTLLGNIVANISEERIPDEIRSALATALSAPELSWSSVVRVVAAVLMDMDIPTVYVHFVCDALLGHLDRDDVWSLVKEGLRSQFGAEGVALVEEVAQSAAAGTIVPTIAAMALVQSGILGDKLNSRKDQVSAYKKLQDAKLSGYMKGMRIVFQDINKNDFASALGNLIKYFGISGSPALIAGFLKTWIVNPKDAVAEALKEVLDRNNDRQSYNKDLAKAMITFATGGSGVWSVSSDQKIFTDAGFSKFQYPTFLRFRKLLFYAKQWNPASGLIPTTPDAPPLLISAWVTLDCNVRETIQPQKLNFLGLMCLAEFRNDLGQDITGFSFGDDPTVGQCFSALVGAFK